LFALWLKLLIDGLHQTDSARLTLAAAGLAASLAGVTVLSYAGNRVEATLRDRAKHLVRLRTLDLMGKTPTLEIHENPEHLAQLEAFRQEGHAFANVFPSLIESFATLVRVAMTSLLLASVDPLLLVLPLFGAPALLLSPRTSGLFYLGVQRASVPQRRSEHLLELTATPGAGDVALARPGYPVAWRRRGTAHKRVLWRGRKPCTVAR
jgi:ATP-binding cassette subfamily B protein